MKAAEVARHPSADDEKEDERADAAHEDRHVGVKSHEQRSKDGGAEHGDDVLHAECGHLRGREALIRTDDAVGLEPPGGEVAHWLFSLVLLFELWRCAVCRRRGPSFSARTGPVGGREELVIWFFRKNRRRRRTQL